MQTLGKTVGGCTIPRKVWAKEEMPTAHAEARTYLCPTQNLVMRLVLYSNVLKHPLLFLFNVIRV